MTHIAARALAATTLIATSAFAAPPTEMFTPWLYANTTQFLECTIVNASGAVQTVTTEAFMSTGAIGGGPYTQTLAPGEAGGFSLPGYYANVYCKFTVTGKASGYRASISVLEPGTGGFPEKLTVALPGF
jgi:hypothetical protein